MSLKIGNIELNNNVILAPMAGFTDFAFRHLCLKAGAESDIKEYQEWRKQNNKLI